MKLYPLAFLAFACTTPPEPLPSLSPVDTLYVSTAFTTSEIEAIEAGVRLWREGTNGEVSLTLVLVDKRPNTQSLFIAPTLLPGEQRGEAGLFTLRLDTVDYLPDELSMTVAHEIGHYLGLPHLPTGLMQENRPSSERCLDRATLEAFCASHICASGFQPACL